MNSVLSQKLVKCTVCTHSPACAHRPRTQRTLVPCRGSPLSHFAARPSRVAGPGGRVVAVCRARTWPCRGLGRDTAHPHHTAPLSQYTTVYCDTNSQQPTLLSQYNLVYCDTLSQSLKPSACHNTMECIVTHSSSPSLSCHNTLGVLRHKHPATQLPHVAIHQNPAT